MCVCVRERERDKPRIFISAMGTNAGIVVMMLLLQDSFGFSRPEMLPEELRKARFLTTSSPDDHRAQYV